MRFFFFSSLVLASLILIACIASVHASLPSDKQFLASNVAQFFKSNTACQVKAFDSVPTSGGTDAKFVVAVECPNSITLLGDSCGGTLTAEGSVADVFVIVFKSDMSCVWANRLHSIDIDMANDVSFDSTGDNVVVSGYYYAQSGKATITAAGVAAGAVPTATMTRREGYVALFDANTGSCRWITRQFGAVANSNTYTTAAKIAPTAEQDIYFAATTTANSPITLSTIGDNGDPSCIGVTGPTASGTVNTPFIVRLNSTGHCVAAIVELTGASFNSMKLVVSSNGVFVSGVIFSGGTGVPRVNTPGTNTTSAGPCTLQGTGSSIGTGANVPYFLKLPLSLSNTDPQFCSESSYFRATKVAGVISSMAIDTTGHYLLVGGYLVSPGQDAITNTFPAELPDCSFPATTSVSSDGFAAMFDQDHLQCKYLVPIQSSTNSANDIVYGVAFDKSQEQVDGTLPQILLSGMIGGSVTVGSGAGTCTLSPNVAQTPDAYFIKMDYSSNACLDSRILTNGAVSGLEYAFAYHQPTSNLRFIYGKFSSITTVDVFGYQVPSTSNSQTPFFGTLIPMCQAGQKAIDATTCDFCEAGTYNDHNSIATTCTPCDKGTNSTAIGATSSTSCQKCPIGTYNTQTGQTTCSICPAGTNSSSVGATVPCSPCSAGQWQDQTGSATCNLCPAGTNSSIIGATSNTCQSCDMGSYQDQPGKASCILCPAGYNSSYIGATSNTCKQCSAGYQALSQGSAVCTACPAGTAYSSASASCIQCSPGSATTGPAAVSCPKCLVNQYQPSYGASSCLACPGSQISRQGASVCYYDVVTGIASAGGFHTKAIVSWVPPVGSDGNKVLTGIKYQLFYKTTASWTKGPIVFASASPSILITDLQPGSSFYVGIVVTNGNSTEDSQLAQSAQFWTAAAVAPTQVADLVVDYAAVNSNSIGLTWTPLTGELAGGSVVTSYKVYVYNGTDSSLITSYTAGTTGHYLVANLVQNTDYKFAVSAVNNIGEGLQSTQVSQKTLSVGVITSLDLSSAGLNWFLALFPSVSGANSYRISFTDTSSGNAQQKTVAQFSGTRSFNISAPTYNIQAGHRYSVSVVTIDVSNAESLPSTPKNAYTKPNMVTGFLQGSITGNDTVSYTFSPVTVASDLNVSYVVGYVSKAVGGPDTEIDIASPSANLILQNLLPGSKYLLRVSAKIVDGAVSVRSAASSLLELCTTTNAISTASFVEDQVTTNQLRLSWSAPSAIDAPATSYDVTVTGTMMQSSDTQTIKTNSIVLTGLQSSSSYQVSVVAKNCGGQSASAGFVAVTAPGQPMMVTAKPVTALSSALDISWYPASMGGSVSITKYNVSFVPKEIGGVAEQSALVGSTTTRLSSLLAGTTYAIKVQAINQAGYASDHTAQVYQATVPATPSVRVVAFNRTSITVEVSAPASNGDAVLTQFDVFASSSSQQKQITVSAATSPQNVTILGLLASDDCSITASASNSAGSGDVSAALAQSTAPAVVPSSPYGLSVSNINSTSFTLSWNSPLDDGGRPVSLFIVTATHDMVSASASSSATTLVVSGLTPATNYTVVVQAVNLAGTGLASESIKVATTDSKTDGIPNVNAQSGAIVGGILGGIAGLIVLVVVVIAVVIGIVAIAKVVTAKNSPDSVVAGKKWTTGRGPSTHRFAEAELSDVVI